MSRYLEAVERLPEELRTPLRDVLELFRQELAETIKKSDFDELKKTVNELAEAQKKTEEELRTLVREHKKTRQMLGGVSDTIGYTLENEAYKSLPRLLKRDFGIKVEGRLLRRYIEYPDGSYDEVNIFGEGRKNGKRVWVIGETKVSMSKKEIDEFLKKLKKIESVIAGEKILIGVTHSVVPEVERYAHSKGIKIYWSYEF